MKFKTRDFGEVETSEEQLIEFVEPILGFEEYKKFIVLYDEEIGNQMIWLQSTEEPDLCFILTDPSLLLSDYSPKLPSRLDEVLGDGDYMCWVIAVIRKEHNKSTVNLKSPVIVNLENKRAVQIILDEDFPVRYPLMREGGEVC